MVHNLAICMARVSAHAPSDKDCDAFTQRLVGNMRSSHDLTRSVFGCDVYIHTCVAVYVRIVCAVFSVLSAQRLVGNIRSSYDLTRSVIFV